MHKLKEAFHQTQCKQLRKKERMMKDAYSTSLSSQDHFSSIHFKVYNTDFYKKKIIILDLQMHKTTHEWKYNIYTK